MNAFVALIFGAALLAGCTATQVATAQKDEARVVADGQLFCAKATADGPLVVALATAVGAPVIATGAASALVAAECAAIGGIPVSPPAVPASAPVVAAGGVSS
jgi:predicted ATPase